MNYFKKIRENNKGLSIPELIITIIIISIIASFSFANYHNSERQSKLSFSAQQLISDIRYAQNNSLGSVDFNGTLSPGGWGVYFDKTATNKNNYIIFADTDSDKIYNDISEQYKKVNLPTNIEINNLVVLNNNGNPVSAFNVASVTFLPPDPKTYINDVNDITYYDYGKITITLKDLNTNNTKDVVINFFGLIGVQ